MSKKKTHTHTRKGFPTRLRHPVNDIPSPTGACVPSHGRVPPSFGRRLPERYNARFRLTHTAVTIAHIIYQYHVRISDTHNSYPPPRNLSSSYTSKYYARVDITNNIIMYCTSLFSCTFFRRNIVVFFSLFFFADRLPWPDFFFYENGGGARISSPEYRAQRSTCVGGPGGRRREKGRRHPQRCTRVRRATSSSSSSSSSNKTPCRPFTSVTASWKHYRCRRPSNSNDGPTNIR